MKSAEFQNIIVEIEMNGKKILQDYKLVGSLENLIFLGYLIIDDKKEGNSLSINDLKKLLRIQGTSDNSFMRFCMQGS